MAANRKRTDENDRGPANPNVSPGAGAGATHGGGAGSGLGLSETSRARANTDDLSRGTQDAVTDPASAAPDTRPIATPQASRTVPASGLRGTGGGLGDAAGGARRATAAEMTGDLDHAGGTSVELPPGGSRTQGAAQGAGMSRGAADPQAPGSSDPGAGTATTGQGPTERQRHGRTGLGDTQSGGRLQDLDAAFDRRDDEHQG